QVTSDIPTTAPVETDDLPIVDLPETDEDGDAWTADPWTPEPWSQDPWAAAVPVDEPVDVYEVPGVQVDAEWLQPTDPPAGAPEPMLLDDLPLDAMLDGFVVDTGFTETTPSVVPDLEPDVATDDTPVEPADLGWTWDAGVVDAADPSVDAPQPISWSIVDDQPPGDIE